MARFIKKCPGCDYNNNAAAKKCQKCKKNIQAELPAIHGNMNTPKPIVLRETSKKIRFSIPPTGGIIGRMGTIGSDELEDFSTISRRHVKIEFKDSHWTVEDLGSANGTRINGRKIKPGKIEPILIDDVLFIADLKFVIGEDL